MSKRKWYDEKAKRREEELIRLGLDPEKDSARCPPPFSPLPSRPPATRAAMQACFAALPQAALSETARCARCGKDRTKAVAQHSASQGPPRAGPQAPLVCVQPWMWAPLPGQPHVEGPATPQQGGRRAWERPWHPSARIRPLTQLAGSPCRDASWNARWRSGAATPRPPGQPPLPLCLGFGHITLGARTVKTTSVSFAIPQPFPRQHAHSMLADTSAHPFAAS